MDQKHLPKIAGHKVTAKEADISIAYFKGNTPIEICEVYDINTHEWQVIKNSAWFKQMEKDYVTAKQQAFHSHLLSNSKKMAVSLVDIALGKAAADKSVSARVKAIELYTRIGKDPLLITNPNVQINNQTNVQNNTNFNFDVSKLNGASAQELLEMHNSGEIPIKFTEGVEDVGEE